MSDRGPDGFTPATFEIAGPLGRWSAREVEAAVGGLCEALTAASPLRGELVAHAFELDPSGVIALGALARAGAVTAPIHVGLTGSEREAFGAGVRPRFALTTADAVWVTDGWSRRLLDLPRVARLALWERSDPETEHPSVDTGEETGVVLGTSGSEGAPKYVHHGWSSLWANADAANDRLDFDESGCWLATLAWAHVGGLAVALRGATAGATLAFGPRKFDAAEVLEAIGRQKVSHVSLVPAMLHRLLELGSAPPESLRVALLGGAATPPRLVERAVTAGWPIALTYGLTEAGSQVATATPAEAVGAPTSVGFPLADTEIRIIEGEIEIRGPTLFRGYRGEPPRDREGWFATGDLGHLDREGRLYVTGRRRDLIVTGGANIDPTEVEAVLSRHPDVREAVVIGLPDEIYGEIVTAVVVGDGEDLEGRLDRWTRERLSGPRAPRRWRKLDELPRTPTGKVDRRRVRELIASTMRKSG